MGHASRTRIREEVETEVETAAAMPGLRRSPVTLWHWTSAIREPCCFFFDGSGGEAVVRGGEGARDNGGLNHEAYGTHGGLDGAALKHGRDITG
jgi:hypothetical protein